MTKLVVLSVAVVLFVAAVVVAGFAVVTEHASADGSSENALVSQTSDRNARSVNIKTTGLSKETIAMLDLDPASVTAVGSFALGSGARHEVYLAKNGSGDTCFVEERPVGQTPDGNPLGIYGGGCTPGGLAPGAIKISVSAAGDPDVPRTEAVSVVGVAGLDVRSVTVRLRNGKTIPVPLTAGNAFHYAIPPAEVATDSAPAEFQAFDGRGNKIGQASLR